MEALGLDDPALADRLMNLYRTLKPFPEVPAMLQRLKAAGMPTAILSNGTPDMLADVVAAAGVGDLLDAVLSVESVGVFKPHPQRLSTGARSLWRRARATFRSSRRTAGIFRPLRHSVSAPCGATGPASRASACPVRSTGR